MRKRREGRFMVAVMQKCKHFATFAENNDTAGRGRCAQCVFVCAHVLLCGWVQQQHYRERKENDGGEMRGGEGERNKERMGERESRPWQNWRYEIPIINGCCVKGKKMQH